MNTRNDRFNRRMRSYDEYVDTFTDPSKIRALSDQGLGIKRICDAIDGEEPEEQEPTPTDETTQGRKLNAARMRLERAELGYLVPTLMLIVKNRKNRKESIWELMTRSERR